ncbi:MAG TPA: TetR/AcrR family transcriptional regulator [Enterococcus sp.]|nr:TetR/AcrR family transcriptional regulator [Enterococcus sp.]
MEEAFLDVRVQRTMKKITQALIVLLKEKNLGEITVKEIITKAKISRGTFYLHYQDKNDLIQKLKNNYFHQIKSI